MIENRDIYFLPLIDNALQKQDPKKGLQEAFEEIETLGRQPEYKRGFRQFQMFMMQVIRNIDARSSLPEDIVPNELIRDLQLQVIAGVLEKNRKDEQACLDLINLRSDWKREFDKLRAEAEKGDPTGRAIKIIIDKDREHFETIRFNRAPCAKTLRNIKPGRYEFRLDTGRVLGEEYLTREDLLLAYAHPARPLRLAADTGDTPERPTQVIELLNGEVIIRVFPEIENGRLELEIRR